MDSRSVARVTPSLAPVHSSHLQSQMRSTLCTHKHRMLSLTRERHKPWTTELVVCTSSSSSGIAMTTGVAVHVAVHGDSAPSVAKEGLIKEANHQQEQVHKAQKRLSSARSLGGCQPFKAKGVCANQAFGSHGPPSAAVAFSSTNESLRRELLNSFTSIQRLHHFFRRDVRCLPFTMNILYCDIKSPSTCASTSASVQVSPAWISRARGASALG